MPGHRAVIDRPAGSGGLPGDPRGAGRTDPTEAVRKLGGTGTGIVGYNVQLAVEAEHHPIVAYAVTNVRHDRTQLVPMSGQARAEMGRDQLTVLANRGYFSGQQILASEREGVVPYVPNPLTSGSLVDGRLGKQDFVYLPRQHAYRCPAGHRLTWRYNNVENGMALRTYWAEGCTTCAIKPRCTTGKERRVKRWEHKGVLQAGQKRLDQVPQAMALRRQTAADPLRTIKAWMGATHFLTRTLKRVSAKMSLQVLANHVKRVLAIPRVRPFSQAMQA